MDERLKASLDAIFQPRSVAIVGASNNPRRWGYATLRNMLLAGYRHPVYPINPTENEVQGLPSYPSLSQVPGDIDLAVIVAQQDYIDGLIVTPRLGRFDRKASPDDMVKLIQLAEDLSSLPERFGKPVILGNEHDLSGPVYETLKRKHLPFFDNPADCAKTMYGLVKYAEIRNR